MKATQFLDARRNIRKELVAFVSIVMIALLAASAYLGIVYSAATLRRDALRFFNDNALWDLEVTATLLMTEDDLDTIRILPGVGEAESVWQIDTKLRVGSTGFDVSVVSLPGSISHPVLLEGRLPETIGECAVEKKLADDAGLTTGQTLHIESASLLGIDPLAEHDFRITGVFYTPDHFSYMVPTTPYLLVPEASFNREGLDGAFMKTRIRLAEVPENRYSDAYRNAVASVADALESLGQERAPLRAARLQSLIEQQRADGEAKIESAREELRRARETIDAGWRSLAEMEAKVQTAGSQLDQGEAELQLAESALERLLNTLDPSTDPDAEEKARLAVAVYNLLRDNYYYMGEQYLDALTQIEDGRRRLNAAEAQLAEGEEQVRQAEEALQSTGPVLGESRWAVLDNNGNPGFVYSRENASKLLSLSLSFSSVFLVVGALVIYATISRMVEQHRRLIGVNKALGLFNREILAKYLLFACTAVLLGVGLGTLFAWLPMQGTILNSYEELLNYGEGTRSFLPTETGLVAAGALVIAVGAVFLGCSRLLRQPALALIQGASFSGRRRSSRKKSSRPGRSLYLRLILRNMATDRNRVLVTIVSIAGGCALMVVGFTLRYGISGVPDRQFGGILTYDAEIFYDAEGNPDAAAELEMILRQEDLPFVRVRKESGVFLIDGTLNAMTMIVAENGSLDGFWRLENPKTGEPLSLPDTGVLVPKRFWETYHIEIGDSVSVYDSGLELRQLPVAGVFENYYGQLFFLTPQAYESAFGLAPEENCLFVRTEGLPLEELTRLVEGIEGLDRVENAAADRIVIEQFTSSLNFVVVLMLFIAGMMACFIVANFTVTFLQRKTGELTIMRINGFSVGECIRYVALDLVVTTVLGTAAGLLAGGLLGSRILGVTETPYIQMIREPRPESFLFAAGATFLFAAVTNGAALRRIRRLKLTDIS